MAEEMWTCPTCGEKLPMRYYGDRCFGTPKPATPQPPTWKQTVESAMIDMVNKIDADILGADRFVATPQPSDSGASNLRDHMAMKRSPLAKYWQIDPVPQALVELAEIERKARKEACGITDLMRGVSPSADRALSDFIARRKAKREVSAAALPDPPCRYCGMLAGAHREDCNRPDPPPWRYYPRDCSDLSRAMSTPLPHHPPMSARLMPWRGKE